MNRETITNYILPLVAAILLLVTGIVLSEIQSKISFWFFILAAILFIIIGVAIFLAEMYRTNRVTLGDITLQTIRKLVENEKTSNGTATTFTYALGDVIQIENSSKEIWIYAYDLAWEIDDNVLTDIVYQNLKKGIKYRYIVPDNTKTLKRVKFLIERYKNLKLPKDAIEFRKRTEDLKFIRFGVVIYNATINKELGKCEDCTVVFFPHFSEYTDGKDDVFLCLRGSQTIKFQEDFLVIWDNHTLEITY